MQDYKMIKIFEDSFEDVLTRVIEGFKKEGFGVLTQVDVKQTLKEKIDVDYYGFCI